MNMPGKGARPLPTIHGVVGEEAGPYRMEWLDL
jgi:hypothetical protein